jgi:hypothetical protein
MVMVINSLVKFFKGAFVHALEFVEASGFRTIVQFGLASAKGVRGDEFDDRCTTLGANFQGGSTEKAHHLKAILAIIASMGTVFRTIIINGHCFLQKRVGA